MMRGILLLIVILLKEGDILTNVIFSRDVMIAIETIAYELKRMNDLKEKEMKLKENVVSKDEDGD